MNRIVKLLDRHVMVRKSVADVLLGVAVILINLLMITVGVQKYITTGYGNSYGITPRTFPCFVFGVAILLGAILVLRGIKAAKLHEEKEETVDFHLISIAIFLDIIFFVATMKSLGYPVSNLIMMYVMYWLSGGKTWWTGLILSIIFTAASILFFYNYLKLPIPMGIVEFLFY